MPLLSYHHLYWGTSPFCFPMPLSKHYHLHHYHLPLFRHTGSAYLSLPLFLCYFTDLFITFPLLLKTLVLWPSVFCGFSNSMDEAFGTPQSQLLHLHSSSFLSHLLPHHNPAWQDLKCLSFNFSLSSQLTCWQIPIVAIPPLHYSLDSHHFIRICQLHFPPRLSRHRGQQTQAEGTTKLRAFWGRHVAWGIQGRRRVLHVEWKKESNEKWNLRGTRGGMEFDLTGHCKNSDFLGDMESHWKAWTEEYSDQACIFKRSPVASSSMCTCVLSCFSFAHSLWRHGVLVPGLTIQFGRKTSDKNKPKALNSLTATCKKKLESTEQ